MEETIINVLRQLNSSSAYQEVEEIAIKTGMKILGCERGCFVSMSKSGEFVLKLGIPASGHGVGKISKEYGADFLRDIMTRSEKWFEVVANTKENPKTKYMVDHARTCGIVATIFFPIFYLGESLGLLIFDSISLGKFSQEGIKKIAKISGDIGASLTRIHKSVKLSEQKTKEGSMHLLGQDSASVAHSLRNPLSVIGGLTRRIIKKISESESELDREVIRGYCQIIVGDVERMERIVRDVMGFTKITTKKMDLKPCNVCELLEETAGSFVKFCHSSGLAVKTKFALDSRLKRTKILLDKGMMKFCFEDILRNAIESGASLVKIKAKARLNKKTLVITFANNGEPLDPTVADKIFTLFMTRKPDGTGLGLANARAIIEAHGGRIWAEGKTEEFPKFKTKFKLEIPLL
jgi:signal transduction histidine kinase